jgi:hypothetical protein
MNGEIDYAAVLADLKAKRSALDVVIGGLEQWLSLKGGEVEVDPTYAASAERTGTPGEVRSDSFFGMTIPDAIRACLKLMKRPMGLTELTKALEEGGLLTSARDLTSTVSATLTRMKRMEGDVVPVQGRWGLSQWYPGMRKEKIEATAKPKKKKRQTSKSKAETKAPKAGAHGPTPEQIAQIKQLNAEGKKLSVIAKEVGLHHLAVWKILKPQKAA